MAVSRTPWLRLQFFDDNGNPLSGGQVFTYAAGSTSITRTTFSDSAGAVANSNPIILDLRGEANCYLTEGLAYNFLVKDSNGVLVYSEDNVTGIGDESGSVSVSLAVVSEASSGAAESTYTMTSGVDVVFAQDADSGSFIISSGPNDRIVLNTAGAGGANTSVSAFGSADSLYTLVANNGNVTFTQEASAGSNIVTTSNVGNAITTWTAAGNNLSKISSQTSDSKLTLQGVSSTSAVGVWQNNPSKSELIGQKNTDRFYELEANDVSTDLLLRHDNGTSASIHVDPTIVSETLQLDSDSYSTNSVGATSVIQEWASSASNTYAQIASRDANHAANVLLQSSASTNRADLSVDVNDSKLELTHSTGQTVTLTTTADSRIPSIDTDYIDFTVDNTVTSAITAQQGRLYWNDDDQTLNLATGNGVNSPTLQIGQEQWLRVRNNTGTTLPNGCVVYIDGAQGQRPTVTSADKSTENLSSLTVGLLTEEIANNGNGFCTTFGLVRNLNTAGLIEGGAIYLDTSGTYTQTEPATPNHAVRLGEVIFADATEGILFISVNNGWELEELHNVDDLIENAMALDGYYIKSSSAKGYWTSGVFADDVAATPTLTDIINTSANWNSVYNSVLATSGNWDNVYTSVNTNSANWDNTYTSVNTNSGNWDSVYTSVNTTSGNWDSVYNSVLATSGNWDNVYTSVNTTSGNWNNVYTTVNTNSASWLTSATTDNTISGDGTTSSPLGAVFGAIDHDQLLNFTQTEHRIINDGGTSTIELWSSDKINTELGTKLNTADINTILLDDLGDVVVSAPINGQSLVYSSATSDWRNTGAGEAGSGVAAGGAGTLQTCHVSNATTVVDFGASSTQYPRYGYLASTNDVKSIDTMRLYVYSVTGNIDFEVGLYRTSGAGFERLTTGSVTVSATGYQDVTLASAQNLTAGTKYYASIIRQTTSGNCQIATEATLATQDIGFQGAGITTPFELPAVETTKTALNYVPWMMLYSSTGGDFNSWTTTTKTTDYTAVRNNVILADSTGGDFTITLPDAGSNLDKEIVVKKISSDTNTVTVSAVGVDTIDGDSTTLIDLQYASISVISDGSKWWIR